MKLMQQTTIEKHQFKITVAVAVSVMVFFILATFQVTTWMNHIEATVDNVDTRQEHLANKYVDTNERITKLEDKDTSNQVQFAEINTKLCSIETILTDIQMTLRGN